MSEQRGAPLLSTTEKRMLQIAVAVAGLVPVGGGLWGVLGSHLGSAGVVNHERYLSGLLFAIGLAFWATIPDIEHKTERFRLLASLVFVGGLCRLLGVAMGDGTSWAVVTPLLMELLVTPALCLWQARIAREPLLARPWHPTQHVCR